MNGIDRQGREVTVDKSGKRKKPGYFARLTLQQARATLARLLLADCDPEFAATILRTSRATLYRDASTPGQSESSD